MPRKGGVGAFGRGEGGGGGKGGEGGRVVGEGGGREVHEVGGPRVVVVFVAVVGVEGGFGSQEPEYTHIV
jgi:hypothetical protein